jgi:hypothetical protein
VDEDSREESKEEEFDIENIGTHHKIRGAGETIQILEKKNSFSLPNWSLKTSDNLDLTHISNNTGMGLIIGERLCRKFDILYSRRSYMHWFLREGKF